MKINLVRLHFKVTFNSFCIAEVSYPNGKILLKKFCHSKLMSLFLLQLGKLFSYTWTMGEFSCKLLYYLQGVSGICSALNLTSLGIERYVTRKIFDGHNLFNTFVIQLLIISWFGFVSQFSYSRYYVIVHPLEAQ